MFVDREPSIVGRDRFADRYGRSELAWLSPSSRAKVHSFYENCSPLWPSEKKELAARGLALLPERGRYLPWSIDEQYSDSLVLRRRLAPSSDWTVAAAEARVALRRDQSVAIDEWQDEAKLWRAAHDDYMNAEKLSARSGRLWGRWTAGHRDARERAAQLYATRETIGVRSRDKKEIADRIEEQVARLNESTESVANATSWHCVGRWCVGVTDEMIRSSDLDGIAVAQVVGQTVVALMLEEFISDDTYRTMMRPWTSSSFREPWNVAADGTEDEADGQRELHQAALEREEEEDVLATDAKSVLGSADMTARKERLRAPADARARREDGDRASSKPTRFERGSAHKTALKLCAVHPACGPVTREGGSGHGHGPNDATGLWCWHFDDWWLGHPEESAPEGSDLAARRAQQAALNGGDPFAHKTYSTPQ